MADFFGLGSLPAARLCHGLAPDGEGCGTAVDFAQFEASEKELEHHIDHKPLEMHMEIAVAYNFLSR